MYKHVDKNKIFKRGKSPLSYRSTRKNNLNDCIFKIPDITNCYWAGFLAADGNVDKTESRVTTILAQKDTDHLYKFKNFLEYEGEVRFGESKYSYKDEITVKPFCNLTFTSREIIQDLNGNFNITSKKSLTLLPPNLTQLNLIDAFIIGYIDGDGSVGLQLSKRQKSLHIQILGTLEIINWIQNRFSQILNEPLRCIYKNRKFHEKNTFSLQISDARARKIFLHYYSINVSKLNRKWSEEFYLHCSTYKKFRNTEKYQKILNLQKSGKSQKEIAKIMNITQAAISWYQKQVLYKELDSGEVNIEDSESQNTDNEEK